MVRNSADRSGIIHSAMIRRCKPSGHWNDIAKLEQELRAFIAINRPDGAMPTVSELNRAGRSDLINALRGHGGLIAVAARLGLERPHVGKPRGYWQDFANLRRELYAFAAEQGIGGEMPTLTMLEQARRSDLAYAIEQHGGVEAVATRAGLQRIDARRAAGFWDDFGNIQRELSMVMVAHNIDGEMPTRRILASSSHGLLSGIERHGGMLAVAARLGLQVQNKPSGYWTDFANLERELRAFIAAAGPDPIMPTFAQLSAADRDDLANALPIHGGSFAVAKRLGLQPSSNRKPPGYWQDIANIEKEIRAWCSTHGDGQTMPGYANLMRTGDAELHGAIREQGGYEAISARLGLVYVPSRRPKGYWQDFANVEREIRAFITARGPDNVMPTRSDLDAAGEWTTATAIDAHGGFPEVARRLGLELLRSRTSRDDWDDPTRLAWEQPAVAARRESSARDDFVWLEAEMRAFMAAHPSNGRLPTILDLIAMGCDDLADAVLAHGGYRVVAERLGLAHGTRVPTSPKPDYGSH